MEFEIVTTCTTCKGTGIVEDHRDRDTICVECEGMGSNVYNGELYEGIVECAEDYPKATSIRQMHV